MNWKIFGWVYPKVGDDRRNSEPDEKSAELIQSEETGKNWKENQSLPYVKL